MPLTTYLKVRHNQLESKFHKAANQLESTYGLIHDKLRSKFHKETTEIKVMRTKLNILMQNARIPNLTKAESVKPVSKLKKPFTKTGHNFYDDNIDWTRGRFSGKTVHIVIRNSQIIEKIFFTNKGTIISVKRSELGFFARLSLKK